MNVMAEGVKQLAEMCTGCVEVMLALQATPLRAELPANTWWEAVIDGSRSWASDARVGDVGGIPGS